MYRNMVRVFARVSTRGNTANWYKPLDTEYILDV